MAEDPLQCGLRDVILALERSEQAIRGAEAFGTDTERAAGYAQLVRNLVMGLEAEVLQDPDFPCFGPVDLWRREAGSNPDQCYACSPVRGGKRYRIYGRLGSARSIELQLYAGQPWTGPARSVGLVPFEALHIGADGRFEVDVVPHDPARGELHNPPDATTVMVRCVYDDWSSADPAELHIDRVGFEGRRVPPPSGQELGRRLSAAARAVEQATTVWPTIAHRAYVSALPVNTLPAPHDTHAQGGVHGRWMATGHYRLDPGTALVVRMPATEASYQAIQLTDLWFAALERGNRISSLTTHQAVAAPDGAYYHVVAAEDPGAPNWLDAGGFERGIVLLRYDGLPAPLPESQQPSAQLIALPDLPDAVPGFEPVGEAERQRARQVRRRHLQRRFGC